MKSFTRDEFLAYVKTLEFTELGDCADFVIQYYEYYQKIPEDKAEEKKDAWEKYVILMTKFGSMFVYFTSAVIDFRKRLNEEIQNEENNGTASLEAGTD